MNTDYVSIFVLSFVKPFLITGAVFVVLVLAVTYPKFIGWLALAWLGWLAFWFIYLSIYDAGRTE